MCQSRRIGKPRTSSSTSRPLDSSSAHAYRDRTASPRPDSTACLMAPLEPSSIAICSLAPAFLAAFSSDHRLPEAGSRITNGWSLRSFRLRPPLLARRWPAGATTTSSSVRNGRIARSESLRAGPTTARSSSLRRTCSCTRARVPISSEMTSPGCSFLNAPRAAGRPVQDLARLCELNSLAEAVEQGQAQRLFQLFDLVRDRRLAEPELLGGEAEAPEVGHRLEGAQLTQRHRVVEV